MSRAPSAADRHLPLACGALGLAVLGHVGVLPTWIGLLFIVALATRLLGVLQPRPILRRTVLAVFALGSGVVVLANFRTLNGLTAGTSLLVAMAALKVVETERPRDYATLAFIVFFLSLASLLRAPSPLRLAHALACTWLGVQLLLETQRPAAASPLPAARQTARLLGLGLPLAVVLFIFVPRLEGRFWAVPSGGSEAGQAARDRVRVLSGGNRRRRHRTRRHRTPGRRPQGRASSRRAGLPPATRRAGAATVGRPRRRMTAPAHRRRSRLRRLRSRSRRSQSRSAVRAPRR